MRPRRRSSGRRPDPARDYEPVGADRKNPKQQMLASSEPDQHARTGTPDGPPRQEWSGPGCRGPALSGRLVALAQLIDPTYRRRRIASCRSTRRRDNRQPPSGPAPPHAPRAGDHKRPPDPPNLEERTRASHISPLRCQNTAPKDGVEVKDLRPLTRSTPRGPIPESDAATGAAQKRRRMTEKGQQSGLARA